MRLLGLVLATLVMTCCAGSAGAGGPSTRNAHSPVFLPRCSDGRPQSELDYQGLPPLVPQGSVRCLLVAQNSGTAYDAGYSAVLQLTDGRQVSLYERRGGMPVKPGAVQVLRSGSREINAAMWRWNVLENGSTTLERTVGDVYVQVFRGGDEAEIDALAVVAASLTGVENLPRPKATEICASLPVGPGPITVAAAFDSSAGSVVRWEEVPAGPNDPRPVSGWRQHPVDEPVAVCYLDGDFGPAKQPAPLPGSTASLLPNWNRVVYLVGVNRYPNAVVFGWQNRITIRDPGP